MRVLVTTCTALVGMVLLARCLPQPDRSAAGATGAAAAAMERMRQDCALAYHSLAARVRSGEIANANDMQQYFAYAGKKVDGNVHGPLGAELGRTVGPAWNKDKIAAAADRVAEEFGR
jgi:hypothetical protein